MTRVDHDREATMKLRSTSASSRVRAHAAWETRLLLRNGEQLLLVFLIPIILVLTLGLTSVLPGGMQQALPTVLTVSVLAACFTSLAIATGFERRSGALRFLATTPLTRSNLLAGKALATAAVTLASMVVVIIVAGLLGWRPASSWPLGVPLVILGCLTFAGWGLLLAGTVRAEAVLAIANGVFLILTLFGGIIIPTKAMPAALGGIVAWLPTAALAGGLRTALDTGTTWSAGQILPILILLGWALVGALLARRYFRWE